MKKSICKILVLTSLFFSFSQCVTHIAKVQVFDKDKITVYKNYCPMRAFATTFYAVCNPYAYYVEDYMCVVEKTGELSCNDVTEKYKNPSTKL
ncbi:hypothetical protein [Leptospira stimsonii]|uniref:Lipoprotein n=1 Tax=Leptospira stimsonii TaxID=2202203 RepID=A0A396Z006_9LEPT|nr:hypothetical protein [Leptospira stimsonii]RHX87066.1 hypothetical protein DLM75_19035 [Leptospira stimsonii]